MEWNEIEEKIKKTLKPHDELMRKLISELDGKTMDYESCRILEEAIAVERGVWLRTIKLLVEELRRKVK